jgi:hypothetical protein
MPVNGAEPFIHSQSLTLYCEIQVFVVSTMYCVAILLMLKIGFFCKTYFQQTLVLCCTVQYSAVQWCIARILKVIPEIGFFHVKLFPVNFCIVRV